MRDVASALQVAVALAALAWGASGSVRWAAAVGGIGLLVATVLLVIEFDVDDGQDAS